jgi:hypothetical protein
VLSSIIANNNLQPLKSTLSITITISVIVVVVLIYFDIINIVIQHQIDSPTKLLINNSNNIEINKIIIKLLSLSI